MPDDGRGCPECEKVIINGDIAGQNLLRSAGHLEAICELIERHVDAGRDFTNLPVILEAANKLEDDSDKYQKSVDKFRKLVLEGIGFNGPWPKSLS